MEPGAHPRRHSGPRNARHQPPKAKRSTDSVGRPSCKIEAKWLRAALFPHYHQGVLRLLIDTSVWLDIVKRRDGQRIIVPLRVLMYQKKLEILAPSLILNEFERNRPRAEESVSASIRDRFKAIRQDLQEYGDTQGVSGSKRWST